MRSKLELFVAAAQFMSLTKAAAYLAISQPAVSKGIKELENEYNVTLFNRDGRRWSLTREGERFLLHAKKILSCYNAIKEEFGYLSGGDLSATVKIRVGATPFLAASLLPEIMAGYQALFFNSEAELRVAPQRQLIELAGKNEIDLLFTENGESLRTEPDSGFIEFLLFKYEMLLVAAKNNGIDTSSGEAFIGSARYIMVENGCCSGANSCFSRLKHSVTTDSLPFAVAMLLSGENYCMPLPSFVAEKYMARGEIAPISPPDYTPERKEAKLLLLLSSLKRGGIENFTNFARRHCPGT